MKDLDPPVFSGPVNFKQFADAWAPILARFLAGKARDAGLKMEGRVIRIHINNIRHIICEQVYKLKMDENRWEEIMAMGWSRCDQRFFRQIRSGEDMNCRKGNNSVQIIRRCNTVLFIKGSHYRVKYGGSGGNFTRIATTDVTQAIVGEKMPASDGCVRYFLRNSTS